MQPDALIVPAFVTVPAYPGAQIVHADTDILPVAEPEVRIPTGHDVHDDEPGKEEYVPDEQIEQLTVPVEDHELSVVRFVQTSVDVPKYPAEQAVYA